MNNVLYWIGVTSREHVHLGVKGGFAQFSHGKLAPARRPSPFQVETGFKPWRRKIRYERAVEADIRALIERL